MRTWKQNGQTAAEIAGQTVKGFEALTRPDSLVDPPSKVLRLSTGLPHTPDSRFGRAAKPPAATDAVPGSIRLICERP